MRWASVSALKPGSPRIDLADRVVDDLLEARHVRALLPRAEVDEALELALSRAARLPAAPMRMTFSTPVTPTRERETCTVGGPGLDVGLRCDAERLHGRLILRRRRAVEGTEAPSAAGHCRDGDLVLSLTHSG